MLNKLIILVLGIALGYLLTYINPENTTSKQVANPEKEILYWVAPMDPDFRRDKPGKSPMGMDLVPFYAGKSGSANDSPGTIFVTPDVENNLGVKTAEVERRHLNSDINAFATVGFNENEMVSIHSVISGWIENVSVYSDGDYISEGDTLYEIYAPEFVNAQQELIFALNQKNRGLIQSATERLQSMQFPQDVIDQLKQSRKVRRSVAFKSTQSGIVQKLNLKKGDYVTPAKMLMVLAGFESVWIQADVYGSHLDSLRPGLSANVTFDDLPGYSWLTSIDYVYPVKDIKTRTLQVRLNMDNKEHILKPNMLANVVINIPSDSLVLAIPENALIQTGSSNRAVLAIGEGKFKSVEVIPGRHFDNYVEILSGLDEGEKIVTSAQFLLDSESSKTSDFKRLNHHLTDTEDIPQATTSGIINTVSADNKILNISRNEIKKWNRPPATMDFVVDESLILQQGILSAGDHVGFSFSIRGGEFVITEIHKMSSIKE